MALYCGLGFWIRIYGSGSQTVVWVALVPWYGYH